MVDCASNQICQFIVIIYEKQTAANYLRNTFQYFLIKKIILWLKPGQRLSFHLIGEPQETFWCRVWLQAWVVGISLDTSASNTGRLNGICALMEKNWKKFAMACLSPSYALSTMCSCVHVFKAAFSSTSDPEFQMYYFLRDSSNTDPELTKKCTVLIQTII